MKFGALLGSIFIYIATPVSIGLADGICDYVDQYMSNAPSKFLAERGNKTSEDTWDVPTGMPNSKCEILISNQPNYDSYDYSCTINRGQNWGSVGGLNKKIYADLISCLKNKPIGWEERKNVIDKNNKSTFINSWRTERNDKSASFEMRLSATQDKADKDNYLVFHMNFTERK